MRDILEQDYLNVESEEVLFVALSEWGGYYPEEAERLLGLIRFLAMTPEQVEKCWDMNLTGCWDFMLDKEIELLVECAAIKDPDLLPEGKKNH